ncbi:MAG: SIMPL domain-containing protein, partial [Patescibacteria group bacterium]
ITSDLVKWRGSLTRQTTALDLQNGYKQIAADLKETKTWLANNGLKDSDLEISPVFMNEIYKNYQDNSPKEYSLRQTIVVQSGEINKVSDLAKNVQELINKGVLFATDSLEYYSSEVPKLRVELLAEAVQDAKARAKELAESNGQSVGSLKQAASGVVQVLSSNSADISDYGAYDTSSIEKEIMVTVRATFNLR